MRNSHQLRRKLLGNNFFIKYSVGRLRKLLKIPSNGFGSFNQYLEWKQNKIKTLVNDIQTKVNNKTSLDKYEAVVTDMLPAKKFGVKSKQRKLKEQFALEYTLEYLIHKPIHDFIDIFWMYHLEFPFLLGKVINSQFIIQNPSSIYVVTGENDPIQEPGVYIKINQNTPDREVLDIKRAAADAFKILELTTKLPPTRKTKSTIKQDNIHLYEEVEKHYHKIFLEDKARCSLERVFQEIATKNNIHIYQLRHRYYQVQKSFQLPSVTDTQKIPHHKS
jgi:hypothetical protein